jgi:hypothetical protein
MYGKSVMPFQPDNVWQTVYSGESWVLSAGEDKHRRALYTFSKRTSPYPSAMMFDGSSREVCVVQRVRTNTPLQALVTLNDPVFTEAAVALASTAGNAETVKNGISAMFSRALLRNIKPGELQSLMDVYVNAYEKFLNDSVVVESIIGCSPADPKLAALSVSGLAILNLDEFLMKE